ncbi:MAG: hypothetical protein C0599_07730, partial [Salinivirgaceae bacterium]
PSELPSYLLNGSPLGSGSIGISDPDLDSAAGAAQAIQRAKAIFYLSRNAYVRSLFDHFVGEEYSGSGGTFQSFVEVSIKDSVFPEIVVIDTFYTRFNEAIVRISPASDEFELGFTVGKSYKIFLDKYRMEYEWGGATEFEDQSEMRIGFFDTVDSQDDVSIYQHGDQIEVVRMENEQEIEFPQLRYNYKEFEEGKQQYFKYGLWVHFVSQLVEEIAVESRKRNERIKKAGEVYESHTLLNQGVASNILSFEVLGISLKEGKLNLELNIELLDTH